MKMEAIAQQQVIEAERCVLRPLAYSDKGMIEMYSGDERVARMTRSVPHPMPPGAADAYIERAFAQDRVEDIWVMDGTSSGGAEVMGIVSLQRMDRNQTEIRYWVAPAYWNTGLASSTIPALLAANPNENETIFAEVFQDNPASARVLTNCGFQYLGDAETFSVARNANVPTWTYSKRLKS
ncbi:MAG: GNAT family N-acetyltransferase [Paracoccaceae bacterium]|nr:GNAT family N-acetyltransferase [Paracoccaceae bacterium]MDG1738211.1 GNAT family N-acetyltransferase [Paracoccaceae bacterium]MDG2260394.1 GNAT family N-acetyltransferase [Paracoccaceae bacterium]